MPRLESQRRRRAEALLAGLALVFVYYLVAAASFSGYFSKWSFRDDADRFTLDQVFDGSAHRPFVYRRLVPIMVGSLVDALPAESVRRVEAQIEGRSFSPDRIYAKARTIAVPDFRLKYFLTYYLIFFVWLSTLFLMRQLCLELGHGETAATLAPLLFALIFPLLLTEGGYYYDFPEMLFFTAALLLARRARVVGLIGVTLLATLNKESFLFFVPTLYPLLRSAGRSRRVSAVCVVALMLSAGLVNALVKAAYADNPGNSLELHVFDKLEYLSHLSSYLRLEANYGVLTTKGFNLVHLLLVVGLAHFGYRRLAPAVRAHLRIALLFNVPLFVLAAPRDELRNLSFLFPSLLVLAAAWIEQALNRAPSALAARIDSQVATSSAPEAPRIIPPGALPRR